MWHGQTDTHRQGEDKMLQYFMNVDQNILLWLQDCMRSDLLNHVFIAITSLGNGGAVWIILSLGLLIPKKTRPVGVMALAALACSAVVNNLLLKNLVARTRPYEVIDGLTSLIGIQSDYSFPSGHTASSFACAVVLFLGLPKRYGIWAVVLACLIAFSRLYVGVHFPTDVLGGILSGVGIAILTYQFGTILQNKRKR